MGHDTPEKSETKKIQKKESDSKTLKILDTIAKLAAAGAVVYAAFLANNFQAKMTNIKILSEREHAESELRATMFTSLIDPISGPHVEAEGIPVKREKLLVELLALNFNEHFEFKPLLEHIEARLKLDPNLSIEEKRNERDSLTSIAKRISDRQIASLFKESDDEDRIKLFSLKFQDPNNTNIITDPDRGLYPIGPDLIERKSPDETWTLSLTVRHVDWEDEKAKVSLIINDKNSLYDQISKDFTLTPFDFPFTDNTLLPDGNRFALVYEDINIVPYENNMNKSIAINLIWFPKNYFTPRERPVNYGKILENLNIERKSIKKILSQKMR